jgi:hypothetical protein
MSNGEDTKKAIEELHAMGTALLSKMEADAEEDIEPDFELKLTEIDVTSGSIPITWCLSKKWLESNNIRDYWVLFIVAPPTPSGRNAEWRGYAKLSDMMAYITFYRPGKNRVYARLSNHKETVKDWMSRYEGHWKNEYVNYPSLSFELDEYQEGKWNFRLSFPNRPWCSLDLDMPTECFAAEPCDFEKTWVNWLWRDKSVDQCEFRKRRIFAYSIQPFLFLFAILLRFIVAFAVAFAVSTMGCKKVNYSPLWMPLSTSIKDIVNDIDGTHFVIKKLPEPFCYVFMLVIPLALISGILGWFFQGLGGLWLGLIFPLGFFAIVGAMLIFGFLVAYIPIVRWLRDRWDAYWMKVGEERDRQWAEWESRQRVLMMCNSRTRITRIGDLPKKKRTVRLRFQGVKSLICKPFAK